MFILLTAAQNRVVEQQSNRFRKSRLRRRSSDVPKTKNVSLILCQSSEHWQGTLLTKFLGQFIELHNTQIF